MSGTHRHGRVYCQVPGCRRPAVRAVEIDLPAAWEPDPGFTTLTVTVGLCRDHGHEVARRVRVLLEARSEFPTLLHIIDGAVTAERELLDQVAEGEAEAQALREQLRTAQMALGLSRARERRMWRLTHFPASIPAPAPATAAVESGAASA